MCKKKKIVFVVCAAILLTLIITGVLFMTKPVSRKNNGIELIDLSVGDKLTGYSVWDSQGKELDVADISSKDTLVVLAMKGCRDCIAEFDSYRILFPIYNNDDFSVVFIWDDEIPQEDLDKLNIPAEASYSARGKYKFSDWVPSYYFLNSDNEITMQTADIAEAVNNLPEITVTPKQLQSFSNGTPILLGINGCGSCKKAREQLNRDGTDYKYIVQGEKIDEDESVFLYDSQKILSKALGIDAFPTYVYGDEEIIIEEK